MKFKHSLVLSLLLFFFASLSLQAGTGDEIKKFYNEDKVSLTVEKCIEIGLEYSKSFYASAMDVKIAEAKYKEIKTQLFPSLKLESSYSRLSKIPPFEVNIDIPGLPPMNFVISESILNFYNLKLSLQQPLFTGFALENAVKAARLGSMAAREIHAKDRGELIFNIKNAYWSLYKAMEFKKLMDENVQLIEAHLNDVQRFFDQGLAKLNDVLKVQVQLSAMKVTQVETKQGVRLAMMALNNLLGLPLDKEIELVSKVEVVEETLPDASSQVQKALAARSEMKAMNYNLQAAGAAVKIARAGYFPQLFLVANYYYANPNTRVMPMQEKFQDTWDVSLGLSLNLWNWRATAHQVGQANAQLAKVRAVESQLKDMITLEVQQNYFDLLLSKEKIDLSEQNVKQAEENYRITNERFKAGLTTNSELLDAEVALLQAKVGRTQVFIDYELARARLHKSINEK